MKYAAIVLMFGLLACDSKKPANVADSTPPNPASVAVAPPPPPPYTPCVADEDAKINRCANLLRKGWHDDTGAKIGELWGDLKKMMDPKDIPTINSVEAKRQSAIACRANGKTVDVKYYRPMGMDRFPRTGTNHYDFVVGIMLSMRDDGCPEFKYGPVRTSGVWTRRIQFVTVSVDSAALANLPPGVDVVIGKWHSWGIEQPTSGASNFKFVTLDSGDYKRCGHPHAAPHDKDEVGFISCADAGTLMQRAMNPVVKAASQPNQSAVALEFSRLMALYRARDTTLLKTLSGDPFDAPAWGLCGNLGCCAMY